MIRTLLAHGSALARGALAFVLRAEDDIEVVAEVGELDDLTGLVLLHHPDVTVIDSDLLPPDNLAALRALPASLPVGAVLVLTEARRSHVLEPMLAGPGSRVCLLAKEGPPRRLVNAVRSAATGEAVVDPELVVSAIRANCPLTPRETQVLRVAAEGAPIKDIATRLALAPGTVRNHLSRIVDKVGARTRIEAVKMAQESGWI